MKYKVNRKLLLIILLLTISLGYAILSNNIHINGSSLLANSKWDIHFANINVSEGSVEIDSNDNTQSAATIDPNDNTKVAFNVSLKLPGDYYEFTVDVVNEGTVDGMVNLVTSNFKIGDSDWQEATSTNLPNYLKYRISYLDDTNIAKYHELKSGDTETYKVRVEFIKDINPEDLPDTLQEISFNITGDYSQTDDNAKDREENPEFQTVINYNKLGDALYNGSYHYIVNYDKCIETYQNEFDSEDLELYCTNNWTSNSKSIYSEIYYGTGTKELIKNDIITLYESKTINSYEINKDTCIDVLTENGWSDVESLCNGEKNSRGEDIKDYLTNQDVTWYINKGIVSNVDIDYEYVKPSIIITKYDESYGTDVVIPESIDGAKVVGISNDVFKNKGITSIEFPDTIEYIGDNTFRNNNITKVRIPDTVREIGANAFRDNNLNKVDIKNNETKLNDCSFGVKSDIANNNIPNTYICNSGNEIGQDSYTITFNKNNENAAGTMDNQTIKGDTDVSLSENEYQLEGYKFIKWNTESNGSGRSYLDKDIIKIAKDTTLYAQWAEIHTLTFNTNGGVLENTTKEILKGQPLGELPIPTKENENFAGWYTGLDTGEIVGENHIVQSDMTLYARWVDPHDTYDVTFDKNSEDATGTMNTQNILEGTATTLTENAYSREGYSFVGWNTKADGTGKSYLDGDNITIIEDTTLYAEWVKIHTLTFDKNNNEAVGDNYSINVISGLPTTIPNEVFYMYTLEDKMIDRWNTSSDYTGLSYYANQNIIITSNTSLYAEWSDIKVTPTIYWALQDNDSDDTNETLVISSYEVEGNLSGSFDGNKRFYEEKFVPWIDDSNYVSNVVISGLVVPKYTSYWFYNVGYNADTFTGNIDYINTEFVIDMSCMFAVTGRNATTFDIGDIGNWNTSNVTNMSYMFSSTGYKATTWNIGDISDWDTSKVTDMSKMFYYAGNNATTFDIGDIGNWDTGEVTDMNNMFYYAGYKATTFDIDLSNWNTSNVTNMRDMFSSAGYSATTWSIGDISEWDTGKVTDMNSMFYYAGNNATTFTIDLNEWDTSNVTSMFSMFANAGNNATTFSLDISNWNTSNVTNMSSMFDSAGYDATAFTLDLSNWNTSKVKNMSFMFKRSGYNARTWSIGNVGNWNVSNVTNMSSMFDFAGVLARSWIVGDLSNWNTSKVTNMSCMFEDIAMNASTWSIGDIGNWNVSNVVYMNDMFAYTAQGSRVWTIGNISNWDTSNVTNMSQMFYNAALNCNSFNLDLSGWNTSKVTNMRDMFKNASGAYYWTVKIPKTNSNGIENTNSRMYGKDSSTYAEPRSGKYFTVAS